MPILKTVKSDGGVTLTYHTVRRVEIDPTNAFSEAAVTVLSWPDIESFAITQGSFQAWTWHVPIPLTQLDGTDFMGSVEQALTQGNGVFGGGSVAPNLSNLESARALQWARVKQTRAVLLNSGFVWDGSRFNCDSDSRGDLTNRIVSLQINGGMDTEWTLFDNTSRVLSYSELCQVGQAIVNHVDDIAAISRSLRAQIDDPEKTTVAEIELVVWPNP